MRKLCFVLTALLLTLPAFADITITCEQAGVGDPNVEISYSTSDSNVPRAFGLDISVDSGATIDSISYTDPCFWVYPGTIDISGGVVNDYGTPVAPNEAPGAQGDLGTGAITIEMGSLYAPEDPNHTDQPAGSGVLLTIVVSADCNVTVSGNAARGNVVLEDTEAAVTNLPTECNVVLAEPECLVDDGGTEYDNWVYWDRPDCWCYQRQCRGDIDGLQLGPLWVSGNDLIIFKTALNKPELLIPAGGECADLDHLKLGPLWVSGNDLTILKAYLNKPATLVPPCDSDQDGVPDGVIYNFWTTP